MTGSPTDQAAPATAVFPLHRERRVGWLLGFILLSLAAHAFAFLLFQVVYPQRVTIPPPGVQVALLTPDKPENQAILRWIAAEDPALSAGSASAVPPKLYDIPYRPSYETLRTPPRTVREEPERVEPYPSSITLPLLPVRAAPAAKTPKSPAAPSTLALHGSLAARSFKAARPLNVRAAGPLQPTSYLLGVSPEGAVHHVFVEGSSGDDSADAAGARHLEAGAFSPVAEPALAWGRASITWGDEVYVAPSPRP